VRLHVEDELGWSPLRPAAGAGRIGPGLPADLVLFEGRTWSELLSRPQANRVVLRNGRAIERRLPDYRDLDDLLGKDGA